jgi:hypothetical protein
MQLTDNAPTIIQKVCRLVLAFAGVEFAATPRAEISEAAAPVTRAVEKTCLFIIMIFLLQGWTGMSGCMAWAVQSGCISATRAAITATALV